MTVQEDTLFIHGQFGGDSGVVIVDGEAMQPAIWGDSIIRLNSTKGYAFSVSADNDTSNLRWLTRWNIGMVCSIAYVKQPGTWIQIGSTLDIVGDISSYFLEEDMPRVATFGGLTILPGDRYIFGDKTLWLYCLDTGALQPRTRAEDIDPKQPPWYHVKDARGGITQKNRPPGSILRGSRYTTNRKPVDGYVASPEDSLTISWNSSISSSLYRLQIKEEGQLIIDTSLDTSFYTIKSLRSRASYSWRLNPRDLTDSSWLPWWSFTADRLDRTLPYYSTEGSAYSRTITAFDSGQFASGIKKIEVQANNDNEARILPSRLIDGNCSLTPNAVTIEQIDTTVTIKYAVIITDCDDNTISYNDSIPARPYVGPSRVDPADPVVHPRLAHILTRGEHFYVDGASSDIAMYDIAGNKVVVRFGKSVTGVTLITENLSPGLYTVTVGQSAAIRKLYVLVRP